MQVPIRSATPPRSLASLQLALPLQKLLYVLCRDYLCCCLLQATSLLPKTRETSDFADLSISEPFRGSFCKKGKRSLRQHCTPAPLILPPECGADLQTGSPARGADTPASLPNPSGSSGAGTLFPDSTLLSWGRKELRTGVVKMNFQERGFV